MVVNILDPYIIELLKEIKLKCLILLYYYLKGYYDKFFSSIILFFESAPIDDKNEKVQNYYIFDDKLSNNKSKDSKLKEIYFIALKLIIFLFYKNSIRSYLIINRI